MTTIIYILLFLTIYLCKPINSQYIVIPNIELNVHDVYPLIIRSNLIDIQNYADDSKNEEIVIINDLKYNKIDQEFK